MGTIRAGYADAFDAITVEGLRRRGSVKWSHHADDVLAAWVAEMDFPLAPVLRTALHEAVERDCTGYPPDPDASGLPAACAAWLSRDFGMPVTPGQIRIVPDVLRGIDLAIQTLSLPDSPVVIMTPSYPPFFEAVRLAGRRSIEVPMLAYDGRWTIDFGAVDRALAAGARTILLCNPHNPLGRAFSRAELGALAVLVETWRGTRVLIDELHAPLVYPGAEHVPYCTLSDAAATHSATIVSASKAWNVPGLKCAQIALTNEEDLARWDCLSLLRTHGASILGIVANRVAYERGGPWLGDLVAYLDGNRRLLADLLALHLPRVGYQVPEATYLAWLDCRPLGIDKPADFFLRHAKVALSDGEAFGAPGRGHVRLNFATSRPILTKIVQRMAAALP